MQGLASRLGRWWPGQSSPGLKEAALPPGPRRWPPHPISPGVPEAGVTWPHRGPCPVIPDSRPGRQQPGAELLGCRARGRGAWTVCRPEVAVCHVDGTLLTDCQCAEDKQGHLRNRWTKPGPRPLVISDAGAGPRGVVARLLPGQPASRRPHPTLWPPQSRTAPPPVETRLSP